MTVVHQESCFSYISSDVQDRSHERQRCRSRNSDPFKSPVRPDSPPVDQKLTSQLESKGKKTPQWRQDRLHSQQQQTESQSQQGPGGLGQQSKDEPHDVSGEKDTLDSSGISARVFKSAQVVGGAYGA